MKTTSTEIREEIETTNKRITELQAERTELQKEIKASSAELIGSPDLQDKEGRASAIANAIGTLEDRRRNLAADLAHAERSESTAAVLLDLKDTAQQAADVYDRWNRKRVKFGKVARVYLDNVIELSDRFIGSHQAFKDVLTELQEERPEIDVRSELARLGVSGEAFSLAKTGSGNLAECEAPELVTAAQNLINYERGNRDQKAVRKASEAAASRRLEREAMPAAESEPLKMGASSMPNTLGLYPNQVSGRS